MPTFNYKAKDRSGNTITGELEAMDEHHAAATLREMGHLPMDIRLAGRRAPAEAHASEDGSPLVRYLIYPLWTGVNIRALALFYRQLGTMLASGMTLSEALRSAKRRIGGRLGRIIEEALVRVDSGGRMSDTMARHPRVFGEMQVSLVRVGEESGLLQQMIDRIAEYLEYEMNVRRMISKMMIYPVLVLVFALAIYIALPDIPLLINKGFGTFAEATWPRARVVLAGVIGVIVVMKLLFQFETVRLVWDTVKTAPPVIGTTASKIAMSRFCRAMALMYAAGMPIDRTVSTAADASGNIAVRNKVKHAVPALQAGHSLTESLTKTGAVMPIVLDMLATGEKTGSTDSVVQRVAGYMDSEADATIHKLGIALFVLMILIAAVVVGAIAIPFYMNAANSMMQQAN